jgi:hypothetical protein
MKGLGTWLLAMAQPLLAKILISLGMTITTVTGLTFAYSTLKSQIESGFNGMPAAALQLVALAGFPVALGAILGAVVFVITWHTLTSATKLVFKG